MLHALLPFMVCLQSTPLPGALEIRPGVFVVRGQAPSPDTFAGLKAAGITHVLNLRTDDEGDFAPDAAATQRSGADYQRCPLERDPSDAALDAFRARLKALPKGARALIHCASGNRVGGALYVYWVLDLHMDAKEALDLAHRAGLRNAGTEQAVLAYVARRSTP